uniref:UPF0761 membrane protein BECKTUN1418E_GA0071001_103011 n=1 Tax=Candidatus Kentrum sp. TUN TaxID=2126343 RepID=A0A450ZP47_9GAMM|nr:MAG: membrane protein [Candidatus Kentron sp. TUN]VFK55510.1 MAG: membrane protein [Candidatus Kentron sp. TUN]
MTAVLNRQARMAYTMLLSLVPFIAVGFILFSGFPAFDGFIEKIYGFIADNFLPESAKVVEEHLKGFVDKASALTVPGLIALIATALLSMATVHKTFNGIWKVNHQRSFINILIVYWAVLTLGPFLIGISMIATSYVTSLLFFSDTIHGSSDTGLFLKLLPFFIATLAFALLYTTVPSQRVPIRHAIVGGMVAAILFELAKKGFSIFVIHFSTYEDIYGALAALPVFLIWIYLSWLIVLFGAEFTYCLGNPSPIPDSTPRESDQKSDEAPSFDTGDDYNEASPQTDKA